MRQSSLELHRIFFIFPHMYFIKCLKKLARKDGVENWEMGEDEDDTAQSPPYLTIRGTPGRQTGDRCS